MDVRCTGLMLWWICGKLTGREPTDFIGDIADIILSHSWWWSYSNLKWQRLSANNHDIEDFPVRCTGFVLWRIYTKMTWQEPAYFTGDFADIILSYSWGWSYSTLKWPRPTASTHNIYYMNVRSTGLILWRIFTTGKLSWHDKYRKKLLVILRHGRFVFMFIMGMNVFKLRWLRSAQVTHSMNDMIITVMMNLYQPSPTQIYASCSWYERDESSIYRFSIEICTMPSGYE